MQTLRFLMVVMLAQLTLGGCGALSPSRIGPEASLDTRDRINVFGANPQFNNEPYEVVDLLTRLDPNGRRDLRQCVAAKGNKSLGQHISPEQAILFDRCELEAAFRSFYQNYGGATDQKARRNELQDRLLAASTQRCEAYKVYLKRFQTYSDATFGVLTTILGGAGAITTGGSMPRVLAGLAGISSGVQAEISQSFFANLASYVIVPGIEQRRIAVKKAIEQRRAKSISDYTVEAALEDAARFHGSCTLEAGLEETQELIKTAVNPGLDRINSTLLKLHTSKQILDILGKKDVTASIGKLGQLQLQELTIAPAETVATEGEDDRMPSNSLVAAMARSTSEFLQLGVRLRMQVASNKILDEKDPRKNDAANWNDRIALLFDKEGNFATDLLAASEKFKTKLKDLKDEFAQADKAVADAQLEVVSATKPDTRTIKEADLQIARANVAKGVGLKLASLERLLSDNLTLISQGIEANNAAGAKSVESGLRALAQ